MTCSTYSQNEEGCSSWSSCSQERKRGGCKGGLDYLYEAMGAHHAGRAALELIQRGRGLSEQNATMFVAHM